MKNDIDILLARYFGGNTSEEDMQRLEQWISASTENQQSFDEMTSLYAKLGSTEPPMPTPDTKKAKATFMAYIASQEDKKATVFKIQSTPFYKSRLFQAACITLFIVMSFTGWKLFISEHDMVLATQMDLIQKVLPDQTDISLSKNSKITYSSRYSKRNKIIRLQGEATFKVGHAGKGKLQVMASETFIEDIGTVFAVTDYPESNYISVKVREGEVHFYTKDNNGLVIASNETGVYNKKTRTFKVIAQKLDTLKSGSMHVEFQAMALKDAIDIISNAYKVDIKLSDKSVEERKITVNFDGEDVNLVLQIITQTLDLNLEKGAKGYTLSNKKNKISE